MKTEFDYDNQPDPIIRDDDSDSDWWVDIPKKGGNK